MSSNNLDGLGTHVRMVHPALILGLGGKMQSSEPLDCVSVPRTCREPYPSSNLTAERRYPDHTTCCHSLGDVRDTDIEI